MSRRIQESDWNVETYALATIGQLGIPLWQHALQMRLADLLSKSQGGGPMLRGHALGAHGWRVLAQHRHAVLSARPPSAPFRDRDRRPGGRKTDLQSTRWGSVRGCSHDGGDL